MKTIAFYGASDDLAYVEGLGKTDVHGKHIDETNCNGKVVYRLRSLSEKTEATVVTRYGNGGVWFVTYSMVEEGIPLLGNDALLFKEHPYSMALILTVPDDTTIEIVGGVDD